MTTMETKLSPEHVKAVMDAGDIIEERKIGDSTHVLNFRLENGFEITATSACVDPANYDPAIGRRICLERVESKVWEVEGYLLQQRLYEQGAL